MDTQFATSNSSFVYPRIPTQVSRQDLNRYIDPHLKRPQTGPKPKLSLYKIFHDILYVLHPGMQWDQLQTKHKALHDTNVYQWHKRWAKHGSSQALFAAAIIHLQQNEQLATSVLPGDGSNTVGKKGAQGSATPATSTRKVRKS